MTDNINSIRQARIKYGLTQHQLADLTAIPFRTIQNWEGGQRKCPDYVTKMVVDLLDQKFSQPDYKAILEEVLEMVKAGEARTRVVAHIKDSLEGDAK